MTKLSKLSEQKIIQMFREEWNAKLNNLYEQAGLPSQESLLSPDLKVMHKDSRLKYTVDSVSSDDVTLRTPEGELFRVDADELEKSYELE